MRVQPFVLLVKEVAHDKVSRFHFFLHRNFIFAFFRAVFASGMELASCRRVCRGWDGSLQYNTVHLRFRIRHRNSGEQRLGIWMQRILEDILLIAVFHQVAQVHDTDRI